MDIHHLAESAKFDPPKDVALRVAEKMTKAAEGRRIYLTEEDFLAATNSPHFKAVIESFDKILTGQNVARKL